MFATRVVLLLLFTGSVFGATLPVQQFRDGVTTTQSLTSHLSYFLEQPPFPDAEDRLQSHLTAREAFQGDFQPVPVTGFNIGYTDQRAWLKFSLSNPSAEPVQRYLLTGQRYMRPLVFYESTASGEFVEVVYNDQFQSFDERPVAMPNLVLPITLEAGEEKDYLIYLGAGGVLSLNLQLALVDEVQQENTRNLIAVVFVSGILVALVLINLFHFVALRRPANLIYALMETSIGLYLVHMEGYGFQYLWPDWVSLNMYGTVWFGHASNIFGSLFLIFFLELHRYHKKLLMVPLFFLVVTLISMLLMPFVEIRLLNQAGTLITSTAPMIYVAIGLYVYLKGNKSALYFVAGWLVLAMGNLLFGATVTGLLDLPIVSIDWIRLGTLGEALLLSWGLSDQVRRLNQEFAEAQTQLVDSLEARLEEARERLELELQVDEREQQVAEMDRKLATTSHDVGQPIYMLRLSLLALAGEIKDPLVVENLNRTLDNMELLLQENLDDYHAPGSEVPASYGELFASITAALEGEANDKGTSIVIIHSNMPVSRDIVVPLRRVIQNLVANAVKHAGSNKILIGLRRRVDGLQVHVIDNGVGLPEEGTISETRGSGLGLSIVKEICTKYGWLLNCENHPGKGVHYKVSLNV